LGYTEAIDDYPAADSAHLYVELWVSLASLLRSYTAVHGLNGNREAAVEFDEHRIAACHATKHLELKRQGNRVTWMREDGSNGRLELTDHGRLKSAAGEQEMDMAAEAWARELMQ
jgi:hypothetical protein